MSTEKYAPFTEEELGSEGVTALPAKEVMSILDLAADIDLAIDGAAPIDLAVALNANIMAPIEAAVSANLLSDDSTSQAMTDQTVAVNQSTAADAIATGIQDSGIHQSDTITGPAGTDPTPLAGADAATADHAAPMMAPTAAPDATHAVDALSAPVDGTVVVDSTGHILGTLDTATGNVVDSTGHILGTLNEASGLVVDGAGHLVGTVTNLIDGAAVADSAGKVIGVLDGATGNVVDAAGNLVGVLDPLTGQVLNTVGGVLGTVTDLIDGTTVLDAAGHVVGTLDAATGNVVNSLGTVIGSLDPITGQVLDAAGNLLGTVGDIVNNVTDTVNKLNTGDLLKGDLLNVDVNVDLAAKLAAPINGGVAANANAAAPIDAAVSANILSNHAQSAALAQQHMDLTQSITGQAVATSDQTSAIDQTSVQPPDTDTASAHDPVAPAAPAAPADPAPATTSTSASDGQVPAPADTTAEPSTQPATP